MRHHMLLGRLLQHGLQQKEVKEEWRHFKQSWCLKPVALSVVLKRALHISAAENVTRTIWYYYVILSMMYIIPSCFLHDVNVLSFASLVLKRWFSISKNLGCSQDIWRMKNSRNRISASTLHWCWRLVNCRFKLTKKWRSTEVNYWEEGNCT